MKEDYSMKLKDLVRNLKYYYKTADEVEQIILNCAMAAAGASAVGGLVPVLALPAMIVSCVGAVWTMYVKICNCLKIPIGENILKVLASAALSNIATNLIGVFAVELITAVIPGIGSLAGAAATFGCIYLAGMMFMETLLAFAKKGKVGRNLGDISQQALKSEIQNHTPTKDDVKDARRSFDKNYPGK